MTRNGNGRRTVELRSAFFSIVGALAAVVGIFLGVQRFDSERSREIVAREARILALETAFQTMPSRAQVEELSRQIADLTELLDKYGISKGNLVPGGKKR